MRKPAFWLALLLCLGPMGAFPVGLGDIELRSALNEPLDASIQLRALKPGDVDDMRVQLADHAQFARAGVDRPFVLTSLRFTVKQSGDGKGEILVTTKQPMTEPFLNFLVDLNWAQGRVIREYTVLLDPPVYGAAISSAVERAVTTVKALPEYSESAPEAVVLDETQSSQPAPSMTPASVSPGSYGPVNTTDTLWSLAQAYRADQSVTVQQTMLAMLRANPHAFVNDNINNLKAGVVLRIPEKSEINQLSAADALAEVKNQHALWEEYRQSIGAAVATAPPATPSSAAGIDDSAAGEAVPDDQSAAGTGDTTTGAVEDVGHLEVVGSGSAQDGTGGSSVELQGLQQELTLAQEQSDIQRRENAELEAKRKAADELIERLQRLVDVKDDEIAGLQDRLSEIETDLEKAQQAAMQPPVEAPAITTLEPEVAVPPKAPTFVDKMLGMVPGGDPLVLAAGAGGVVLFAILGILLARRRKSKADWVDVDVPEDLSDAELAAVQPAELPEALADEPEEPPEEIAADSGAELTTDERAPLPEDVESVQMEAPDEDDPLEGLNIYLAYEDYDNAIKLVKGVIEQYPNRHEYKLRLLEIYLASKNVEAFETTAKELQEAVGDDSPMMDNARRWWGDLSPGRALFAAGAAAALAGAIPHGDTEAQLASDESIFDVTNAGIGGGDETMDISLDDVEAGGEGGGVDFDLGFEFEPADLGDGTDLTHTVDFDLDDDTAVGELDDGVQADLSGTAEATEMPSMDLAAATGAELDFDLDFDGDESADSIAENAQSADLPPAVKDPDATVALGPAADIADLDAVADEELDFALDLDATGDFDAEPARHADIDDADDADIEMILDLDSAADESGRDRDAETTVASVSDATDEIEFSLDLDEAGAGSGSDDGLDFSLDLGAEEQRPEGLSSAPELDFDLGEQAPTAASDTGLDLDLGVGEPSKAFEESDEAMSTQYMLRDVPEVAAPDEELDLPLESDAAAPEDSMFVVDEPRPEGPGHASIVESAADADASVDFNLETAEPEEPGASSTELDINAESTRYALHDTGPTDAAAGDATGEVDFSLDFDDEDGADTLAPDFDFDLELPTSAANDFETVQLTTDDLVDAGAIDADGEDVTGTLGEQTGGVEVDGEFADIFGSDDDAPEVRIEHPDSAAAAEAADVAGVDDLDFDLGEDDFGITERSAEESSGEGSEYQQTQYMLRDIAAITSDNESDDDEENRTLILGQGAGEVDEIQTKLDLAQAYIDMGDAEGARGILGEVMAEGDDDQQGKARELLGQLN